MLFPGAPLPRQLVQETVAASAFFEGGLAQEQRTTRTEENNANMRLMLNRAFKLECSYILRMSTRSFRPHPFFAELSQYVFFCVLIYSFQLTYCCACVVALAFQISLGASQSWAFSTSWPNPTAPLRSCAHSWITATGTCSSRTPPSPSTTCPLAASGSDGQALGTSCCRRAPAVVAQARPQALLVPGGDQAPSARRSPKAIFPSSR